MSMGPKSGVDRRVFLKSAGAAAAAGLTVLPAARVWSDQANAALRIGLIGCGNRGIWLGDLFHQNANAKIVAVHDYFQDRVDLAGEKLGVPADKRYTGLDGYKQLLAEGDVDAAAIISPPYFHPMQTVDALAAGKHVYLAKPIAVDALGCQAIVDAAAKAEGTLTTLVDFQTRANEFFIGAAKRVHEGLIGAPVLGQTFYHCGRLHTKTPPGTQTARLRNWAFDIALSGDIIVEQNIHVLDVMNWFLNAHPIKAVGTGGRKARVDVGDCWDHFAVTYTYPDDTHVAFDSAQFIHGEGFSDLCTRVFGSEGTVDAHYGGNVTIRGKSGGWRGGETRSIYRDGAVTNIKAFCEGIAAGTHTNNAPESARSTMTSILGRMAAYSGREVGWDEMAASKERLDPMLDLPADGPQST